MVTSRFLVALSLICLFWAFAITTFSDVWNAKSHPPFSWALQNDVGARLLSDEKESGKTERQIIVTNNSLSGCTIRVIQKSCNCLLTNIEPSVLEPGGKATLTIVAPLPTSDTVSEIGVLLECSPKGDPLEIKVSTEFYDDLLCQPEIVNFTGVQAETDLEVQVKYRFRGRISDADCEKIFSDVPEMLEISKLETGAVTVLHGEIREKTWRFNVHQKSYSQSGSYVDVPLQIVDEKRLMRVILGKE